MGPPPCAVGLGANGSTPTAVPDGGCCRRYAGAVADDSSPRPDPVPSALGPNAWLVDEMHEQYLADPSSVSESWRDFFADYRRDAEPQAAAVREAVAPAAPAAPAKE